MIYADEVLMRVLHRDTDQVKPAPDGLARIVERLDCIHDAQVWLATAMTAELGEDRAWASLVLLAKDIAPRLPATADLLYGAADLIPHTTKAAPVSPGTADPTTPATEPGEPS